MPYYYGRVKDLYENHPNEDWSSSPQAIIGDLAWHFIDEDDTPSTLQTAVYEADDGETQWREPYPDEECRFKQWIDDMIRSEVTQGWRDNLMKCVMGASTQHTINSAEASTILHMAPCSVIQSFIEKTQQSIDEFNQSEASYNSDDTEETIIVESENRDGRQSPVEFQGYGLANRPNSDCEDSESDSDDSMPELENEDDHEEEELRTNQWSIIRHQWQHTITPREYNEIIEGGGGYRVGGGLRHFLENRFPLHGEPMDIDTDEETDEELPDGFLTPRERRAIENLAPPRLTRQVACVLPRA